MKFVIRFVVTTMLVLACGLVSPAAFAHHTNGPISDSNGYSFNNTTGMLTADANVEVGEKYNTAVLYDASKKPQKLVAGPVKLPEKGPFSVYLGSLPCGAGQWDIHTPGENKFIAGHKFNAGPCETTPPTDTPPPVESIPEPTESTTSSSPTSPPVVTDSQPAPSVEIPVAKPATPIEYSGELAYTGSNDRIWYQIAAALVLIVIGFFLRSMFTRQEKK